MSEYGIEQLENATMNISEISEAGADTFVAGSAIFSQDNYEKVISEMRSSIK